MATVMIVDDNRFARQHLVSILNAEGYRVIEAENGEQAVQMYRTSRPNVALMDITMPRKDGLAALTEIMQCDAAARVIMLTGVSQPAIIVKALKLGAKDFLKKPVPTDRLLTTIRQVLR